MTKIFSESDVEFLIKNYPENGAKFCAEILHRTEGSIRIKAFKLKLKLNHGVLQKIKRENFSTKDPSKYKVNPNQFLKINTKEVAYILGILWADGFIYSKKYQAIRLEIKSEDMKCIDYIFKETGKWTITHRNRKNRQPQSTIQTSNKILVEFLLQKGYYPHSIESADKILFLIPDELKHYWFRGLIDGDGCFYINKKNNIHQLSISGSYDQDWAYIINVFNNLNIKYSVNRRKQAQGTKINKFSYIRIANRKDIINFGNYIYKGYMGDKMGFLRKHKKFLEIIGDDQRE